jgi:parallel beta-helix repeat protein
MSNYTLSYSLRNETGTESHITQINTGISNDLSTDSSSKFIETVKVGQTLQITFSDIISEVDAALLQGIVEAVTFVQDIQSPKDDYKGIVDPTVNDDASLGYTAQSIKINTLTGKRFVCEDATIGHAVWKQVFLRYSEVVVPDEYSTIQAAFANPTVKNVLVRGKEPYRLITSSIIIPKNGSLTGETQGSCKLVLYPGVSIICDGSENVNINNGTLSIVHNSITVTGIDTSFITSNVQPGYNILIGPSYYTVASIQSETSLRLAEVYMGSNITDQTYRCHPQGLGASIRNLIVIGSGTSPYNVPCFILRGLYNATLFGVACKGGKPNFVIDRCGPMCILGGASQTSVGVGISIQSCVSILMFAFNISNCLSHGIDVTGRSSALILKALTMAGNQGHGIYIHGDSIGVDVEGGKISYNQLDGVFADESTSNIMISKVESKYNNGCGMNLLGTKNIISICNAAYNASHGANVDNYANVSNSEFIYNGADGLNLVYASKSIISSNLIEYNANSGVRIAGDENIVSNNQLRNNGEYGVSIESGTRNTLVGNIPRDNTLGYYLDNGTFTEYGTNHLRMTRAPTTSDTQFGIGKLWIDASHKQFYITNGVSAGQAQFLGGFSDANPTAISTSLSSGSSTEFSRADHVHALPTCLRTTDRVSSLDTITTSYTLSASDLCQCQLIVSAMDNNIVLTWPTLSASDCNAYFTQPVENGCSWLFTVTRTDNNGNYTVSFETGENSNVLLLLPEDNVNTTSSKVFRLVWLNDTYTVIRQT